MAYMVKQILVKTVQYADEVVNVAAQARSFRQECLEIKVKTDKLAFLLRQATRVSGDLYERPTRRIIDDVNQVLHKVLILVYKCSANGLRRVFTIIPAAAMRKITQQLGNSISNVSWLLRVSNPADHHDDEYLGLPPIAVNKPILCLIWEQIPILCSGSIQKRTDAAALLVSLARDNYWCGKLIIEEGGVPPLLKLVKEGRLEGQEKAARAIGLLGRDPQCVEQIVNAGACQLFAKVLKEGHMKVQVTVAWAVSELAANGRMCQDSFAQNNTIGLLISHLALETIQEHSKYVIPSKQSMLKYSLVMANSDTNKNSDNQSRTSKNDDESRLHSHMHPEGRQTTTQMQNVVGNSMAANPSMFRDNDDHYQKKHKHQHGLPESSNKLGEFEDPATKAEMKCMAARALRYLCAGNITICQIIIESSALLCFAILLEKGPEEVKYHSAMVLMEITKVAQQNADFRHATFKLSSPAAKAIVDLFLGIIEKADSKLLIPSIRSIGNLARTVRASETRLISSLVKLLDNKEPDVAGEAARALSKYVDPDNFLHSNHCNAIIDAGGVDPLILLVYFGDSVVQIPSCILLCNIALHVPGKIAIYDVPILLEWVSMQAILMQDEKIRTLLPETEKRLGIHRRILL
ncbi:hypothetical protein CDL12_01289 [Handroanthus impetiginosus]|uniref:DUF7792 domain-containing protein n=1 Tax=Handroanthus impetiginosus TaxID=429701 RepID=A0A2G9I864_9LAMI|nr:hypothetical protein CDL12_01289 [Handroanthus impetiginosus]